MLESDLQKLIQLDASKSGARLWRNNSGATFICEHSPHCPNAANRPVRFGLGNESAKVNKTMKSSDLIGITPVVVTPGMVGQTVGVFTAVEVKRPGWAFHGTPREIAQQNWINLINSLGGLAKFSCKREGDL